MHVLVTGARAKTGAPLIDLLAQEPGAVVRAGTRDPHLVSPSSAGVRPVRFDWDDPPTRLISLVGR